MTFSLRKWQQEAIELYRTRNKRDFTVTATPGAGKTTFALTIADKLLQVGAVQQVVVVVPTDHLRTQWADAAIDRGIFLDPSLSNSVRDVSDDYVGYVITYAQAASNPALHRRRTTERRTFVIFDEIHHAGDGLTWGDAVNHAFGAVSRRLCLTGTPFRTSPNSQIPFVRYEEGEHGTKISVSDYAYGYGEALKDNVVRPVTFAAYTGDTTWQDGAGDVHSVSLSDPLSKDLESKALRAALSPDGRWIPHVVAAAHERLLQVRESIPDAGGMILASDQEDAKAYARVLKKVTGVTPVVVVSDDNKADRKIAEFRDGDDLWLIAVRMVSEGVDVPRLAVGVWATNYRTPLFFAQAVGRFVRARNAQETATVFLPASRTLLAMAAAMEEQRKHVVVQKEEEEAEKVEREQSERSENAHTTLEASASFDHIIFNGKAIDGMNIKPEDMDFIGIPGLLNADQMAALLRARDAELRKLGGGEDEKREERANIHRQIAETRKDINRLVSRIALTRGVAHAHVHKLSQKAVPGPPSSTATLEILQKRRDWLMDNLPH